jgi:tetratricopeptide (TPR) repeat protein
MSCKFPYRIVLVITLGVLLLPPATRALSPADRQFLWQAANAQMSAAQASDDFLRTAEAYQKLIDAGVRNGPLFANLGTAFLQAGRNPEALEAFLRAERYAGSDPEIKAGIRTAIARLQKNDEAALPWYRIPLCWHFELGGPVRAAIATMAFALFWIALALRFLGIRRIARPLLGLALLGIVLFGSSTATTLYQETHARRPVFANGETETAPAAVTPP